MRYGLRAVHVFFFLEAFWREFESPGEYQRRYDANREQDQNQFWRPHRELKDFGNDIDNLQDDPRGDPVGKTNAKDIASSEFTEETQSLFPVGSAGLSMA